VDVAGLNKVLQQVEYRQAVDAEGAYRRDHLFSHGLYSTPPDFYVKFGDAGECYRKAGRLSIPDTGRFREKA